MKKKLYKSPSMVLLDIRHESCIANTSQARVTIDAPDDGWAITPWIFTPDNQLPQPSQNEISL